MDNEEEIDSLKIVLLGEAGVGKSSIISSFVDKTFSKEKTSSLGATFISKFMVIEDVGMQFNIWDTAGQEKFRCLTRMFYKDATAAILVYDITQEESFKEIKDYWIHQIKESSPKSVIIVIAGNKSDLMDEEKAPENEVRLFASKVGAMYQRISAKNRMGIDELFNNIGHKYLNPSWIEDKEIIEEYKRLKELKRKTVKLNRNRENQNRYNDKGNENEKDNSKYLDDSCRSIYSSMNKKKTKQKKDKCCN